MSQNVNYPSLDVGGEPNLAQPGNQNANRGANNNQPQNLALANRLYNWTVWFVCCKEELHALRFVTKFHSAQFCFDSVILIISLFAVADAIFKSPYDSYLPQKPPNWGEYIGEIISSSIYSVFVAVSLYFNHKALKAAESPDQRERQEGSYRLASLLGMINSGIVTMIFWGLAGGLVIFSLIAHSLLSYFNSSAEEKYFLVVAILLLAIGVALLGLFPLCLAVMACRNYGVLEETRNLRDLQDYGTEMIGNGYQ